MNRNACIGKALEPWPILVDHYRTEVTRLVTNYGFRELGLHRIELTAYCDNVAAIKAYEKAGYQHEGIKRESGYRNGRFMDKVQMSVLSREWPAT